MKKGEIARMEKPLSREIYDFFVLAMSFDRFCFDMSRCVDRFLKPKCVNDINYMPIGPVTCVFIFALNNIMLLY